MIQLSSIQLLRGTKVLLTQADMTLHAGHKVGLIGTNGCGKSSLFAMLRGEIEADEGECSIAPQWNIVSVLQETPASERTAIDYVIDGFDRLRDIQSKLAHTDLDGETLGHLHEEFALLGGYEIEAKAATILNGLGFLTEQLTHPVKAFSGGWRMRLNLARALLCPSDLLLLDEPTNHLDLDTVMWLEKWLQQYNGTMILISHDQSFLDGVVDHIVSFEEQKLITYSGNYSAYEKQRAERERLQTLLAQKQQAKVEHLQSFITRFKAKASKAKQAQSRVKQLEKMAVILPARIRDGFSFSFPKPDALPNPLIYMENIVLGYGSHTILQNVKLNLVPGSRIGLLGRNGAGKSTLIKLLAGELDKIKGKYNPSAGLTIGYFAQHQLELLNFEQSALDYVQALDPSATIQSIRDYLGGFAFNGDQAQAPIGPMSGGEKARLVLALLVYQKPNLLLLDEPTNHLDIEMRQALNIALQSYEGAMVIVSHDRFLLESVCDEYYLVDNQRVAPFDGDLDDYRVWLNNQAKEALARVNDAKQDTSPSVDRKEIKRREAEFRQATSALRKEIDKQEKEFLKATDKLKSIELKLGDTELYAEENKVQLQSLLVEQGELTNYLEELEMNWLENQELLESKKNEFDTKHST